MPLPAHDHKTAGFTLVEMVVVISMIALLSGLLVVLIDPLEMRRKARDVVRLVDLNNLLQAIESYNTDNSLPPDQEGILRRSDQSVMEGQAPQLSDGRGWLGTDLSGSLAKLPTDPLNVWPYVYRYKRAAKKFEVDAVMEEYTDLMRNDNGNGDNRYELGTDLGLL